MNRTCVIIPAHNEQRCIVRAIKSLIAAGLGREHIYVVDDYSGDQTASYAWHMGVNVYRCERNHGKAGAIRMALNQFRLMDRYEWVGVMDADSCVGLRYFEAMEDAKVKYPHAALLCGTPRSLSKNWLTAYRAVEYAVSLGIYRQAQSYTGTITVAPGCASLYRMDVFEGLDFFGGTLVEDMDWTIQIHRQGLPIKYVPEAIVYTQDPSTVRDYVGQIKRWYRGTWQVVQRHKVYKPSQFVDFEILWLMLEGGLFGLFLLTLPYWLWFHTFGTVVAIALDLTLQFVFTLLVARRERRSDVILAFPLYVIPRFLNSVVFVWAGLAERRRHETQWFSVKRY